MKLDVLIASIPGSDLRLVGELLPFLPAHIEHCVLCPRCTGKAGVVDMHCAGCADEDGFSTGYVERRVCMEGDCRDCDRFEHVCQPGHEQRMRFLGCNVEDREGRGCTGSDGEPCGVCAKREAEECAYWRIESRTVTLAEGDPERYRREMAEAGRAGVLS